MTPDSSTALVIDVEFYDRRYHGLPDWPPSPARLFQAIVAGCDPQAPDPAFRALAWLETLCPPAIAAPPGRRGQEVRLYVPNNDLDAVGGDVARVGELRTEKLVHPLLFDSDVPVRYVWTVPAGTESEEQARAVCTAVQGLYQLGRGADMAFARAQLADLSQVTHRLREGPAIWYAPTPGAQGGIRLLCPSPGSLASLQHRFAANRQRLSPSIEGATYEFVQPPKPRFWSIAYEGKAGRRLYELRSASPERQFVPQPLSRASRLLVHLRDLAVGRLRQALPAQVSHIEQALIGRSPDGTNNGPTGGRVRILLLASIGHPHADYQIRRLLVEVPPGCPVGADDVQWSFSGMELIHDVTREPLGVALVPASDDTILDRYGVSERRASCRWRTVTPVVLPQVAARRRINPARRLEEAKDGPERSKENAVAAASVQQALRHAGVRHRLSAIRVQREPFHANGMRAEAFAEGTRFQKERLWHVEIAFESPVPGPLVLGDGRFLGLGLMAPVSGAEGLYAFQVESGLVSPSHPMEVARALRRAVMARVQNILGDKPLPRMFSGHEADGSPAQLTRASHLAFAFDPSTSRVLVLAPHALDRREPTAQEGRHLSLLEESLANFTELRAGPAGCLALRATWVDTDADLLTAPSRAWESATPYHVTRHAKHMSAAEVLSQDLRSECLRRGLPEPMVTPLETNGVSGIGLVGRARLVFAVAVAGPILLGRSRYLGGGLFSQGTAG